MSTKNGIHAKKGVATEEELTTEAGGSGRPTYKEKMKSILQS